VESAGNAPASTCLQGKCIACLPRPQNENGRPPRCCPEQSEFWRLGCASWRTASWNWCGCRELHPGFLRGGEVFWLLNHNRENQRAGSDLALPARAISTKNKHLLVIYSIPTRGFTAAVSVFKGTPPPKPFDCKIRLDTSGALFGGRWAYPTGGEPRLSRACLVFVSVDIIKMSRSFRSQIIHLSFHRSLSVIEGKTKKPASIGVSRV
jgi:hypothetical protein